MRIFSSKARASVALPLPWSQPHHAHASRHLQNKETFFRCCSARKLPANPRRITASASGCGTATTGHRSEGGVQGSIFRQQEVRFQRFFFCFFCKVSPANLLGHARSHAALCSLLADDDNDDSEASGWSFKFDSTISGKTPRGNFNRLKLP